MTISKGQAMKHLKELDHTKEDADMLSDAFIELQGTVEEFFDFAGVKDEEKLSKNNER